MNKFERIRFQERTYSGACSVCNVKLWQRDVEYSTWKKGKPLCKEHFNPKTLFDKSMQEPVKSMHAAAPMATVVEQNLFMDQPGGVDNLPF